MARLARWCFTRRRAVLASWLVGLIGFFAIGGFVGASYNNNSSIPGTDSTRALNLLQADFPVQSGDSEQVVVQAKEGTLRSPAVEKAVTSMLARVGRLPHVASVVSPYGTAGQISRDGKIGFATVNLDASADVVPTKAVTSLISTAQAADSPSLTVQLDGTAIENAEPGRFSSSFLVGLLLALVVLFFAFRRSVFAALLPLVSALMAIGVATSVIDLLTYVVAVVRGCPPWPCSSRSGWGWTTRCSSSAGTAAACSPGGRQRRLRSPRSTPRARRAPGGLYSLRCHARPVRPPAELPLRRGRLPGGRRRPHHAGVAHTAPGDARVPRPKVLRRAERVRDGARGPRARGSWASWAALVGRRAAPLSAAAVGVIVLLAIPFFSLRQGLPDASTDPVSSTTYQAYELLAKGFGPGFNGPLDVVGQVSGPRDEARFASFVASLGGERGVAQVEPPGLSPNGKAAVAVVYPTTGPQEAATAKLVDRVRSAATRADAGTSLRVHVGGDTAANQDYTHVLSTKMPQFLAVVVGVGFLLLALVFRSLLVPLLASAMNLLSFGAALGVMTAVFQYGWGKSVFGSSGPIISWLPSIMFSILFGLSMDYEVFLREPHARRMDAVQ